MTIWLKSEAWLTESVGRWPEFLAVWAEREVALVRWPQSAGEWAVIASQARSKSSLAAQSWSVAGWAGVADQVGREDSLPVLGLAGVISQTK